jgi:hypothetical protein
MSWESGEGEEENMANLCCIHVWPSSHKIPLTCGYFVLLPLLCCCCLWAREKMCLCYLSLAHTGWCTLAHTHTPILMLVTYINMKRRHKNIILSHAGTFISTSESDLSINIVKWEILAYLCLGRSNKRADFTCVQLLLLRTSFNLINFTTTRCEMQ